MWLPPALLLLCLSGCLSLVGPRSVTGPAGGSLTIRCRYEKDYKGYNKYWCRGQYDTNCDKIVETQETGREERNGRVAIRDDADDLTLTVTMESLHEDDAGSYWCKIQTVWILDEWSRDPAFQVQVSVSPAPRTTTRGTTHPATPATFPVVIAGQNFSTNHCPGVLLSMVPFLLLIFLKLPLFLGMLGAVLWVSRCQKGPGGGQSRPDQGTPPCHPPAPGKPCPGIQSFQLDHRDLQALHSRAERQQCLDSAGT